MPFRDTYYDPPEMDIPEYVLLSDRKQVAIKEHTLECKCKILPREIYRIQVVLCDGKLYHTKMHASGFCLKGEIT